MPMYEWRCAAGHALDVIVNYSRRDDPRRCRCGLMMTRQFPMSHVEPDGIYSYAPNIGSEEAWENRRHAIREGIRVIPKQDQPPERD